MPVTAVGGGAGTVRGRMARAFVSVPGRILRRTIVRPSRPGVLPITSLRTLERPPETGIEWLCVPALFEERVEFLFQKHQMFGDLFELFGNFFCHDCLSLF